MNNKIKIEQGKTTICASSKNNYEQVHIQSANYIDQMQKNYNNMENNYKITSNNQENNVYAQNTGVLNINNLATLIPLLKGINSKNDMTNVLEILPKISGQNNNQTNILNQLLPLLINSRKSNQTNDGENKKINSLKRVDED